MAEPCKKLLGRNAFLAVSLVKSIKQLGFLIDWKPYSNLVASREDGHWRAVGQREALDNDFATNDGSRSDLHGGMVLH